MWSKGEITECINNSKTEVLEEIRVKFIHDISVSEEKFPINSDRIAPLNSKREPDEWRY